MVWILDQQFSIKDKSRFSRTGLRPMEFSIKLSTIKSGWFILYAEGSQVITISTKYFTSLKFD